MIVHAGDAIAHAVMLLVYHKSVLFLVILLYEGEPLRLVERNHLVDLFINPFFYFSLILEIDRDFNNALR